MNLGQWKVCPQGVRDGVPLKETDVLKNKNVKDNMDIGSKMTKPKKKVSFQSLTTYSGHLMNTARLG